MDFNVMGKAFSEAKAALEAAQAEKEAAAAAESWEQKAETIEDAMEYAGISQVDVQIDDSGFATLVGHVNNEAQYTTAIQIAEEFDLAGLDSQIEVIESEADEEADDSSIWQTIETEPQPVTYVAVKGDSWWGIARRFYGDGRKWKQLKAANGNPRMLHPGHEVTVPPLSEQA